MTNSVETLSAQDHSSSSAGARTTRSSFDFNWWADLDPDETITPEFRSGELWNYPGRSNKRFDQLVTDAQDTLDAANRKAPYTEACDILMDEAPIAIISHMPVFNVFSQKVKGFKYIPVDSLDLHTVSLG